jgi:hypothetical protein
MTIGFQLFLERAPMTLHTGEFFVSTAQWPARLLVVVKGRSAPVGGVVTIFALLAVAPSVHITAAMTGDTPGFQLPIRDIFKVTGLAGQVLVSSGQPETGFDGVFKSPAVPVSLGMAAITGLSVAAQVHILYPVTADTLGLLKGVFLSSVATGTGQGFMMATQGKISLGVVKGPVFFPTAGFVTVIALLTQGLAVGILILVAVKALRRCLPQRCACTMA